MKQKIKPNPPDVEQILKEIGSRVRMHRKTKAKNYEDFAMDNDFNKVSLFTIETGSKNYTIRNLIQVAHSIDMTLEELFKGIN